HPIYVFSMLSFFSLSIIINNFYLYVFLFIVLIIEMLRISAENKLLANNFGLEYMTYKKSVWF
ncbi:MAG: hypothetical protein EXS50_03595, partial [Candidatus Taylorbacteria bacterium]|nr:hypothetical protein [Candidatus Taylorbacteria bacterium]